MSCHGSVWTRYYLGKEDTTSLESILSPVSSRQNVLECLVLNLCIFTAKKHWIKPIIAVRYKIDNTENLVGKFHIIFIKYICHLARYSGRGVSGLRHCLRRSLLSSRTRQMVKFHGYSLLSSGDASSENWKFRFTQRDLSSVAEIFVCG